MLIKCFWTQSIKNDDNNKGIRTETTEKYIFEKYGALQVCFSVVSEELVKKKGE